MSSRKNDAVCECCGLTEDEDKHWSCQKIYRMEFNKALVFSLCDPCHNNLVAFWESTEAAIEAVTADNMIRLSVEHNDPEGVQKWVRARMEAAGKMIKEIRSFIERGGPPASTGVIEEAVKLDD
jgi:hypothetical protein